MVTNIYSGTASGQALFNDECCISQNHFGTSSDPLRPRGRATVGPVLSWLWDVQPVKKVFLRC